MPDKEGESGLDEAGLGEGEGEAGAAATATTAGVAVPRASTDESGEAAVCANADSSEAGLDGRGRTVPGNSMPGLFTAPAIGVPS